ncbi:hypothetical protein [Paraburkholderia sp. J69-1]|nr:hypothetical protein [Paraburkholderia sp. J69-1]
MSTSARADFATVASADVVGAPVTTHVVDATESTPEVPITELDIELVRQMSSGGFPVLPFVMIHPSKR